MEKDLCKFNDYVEIINKDFSKYEDEKGNLLIDKLIDNLGIKDGYEIDLTTISPLLPNRVILISKEDIESLINDIKH